VLRLMLKIGARAIDWSSGPSLCVPLSVYHSLSGSHDILRTCREHYIRIAIRATIKLISLYVHTNKTHTLAHSNQTEPRANFTFPDETPHETLRKPPLESIGGSSCGSYNRGKARVRTDAIRARP